MPSTRSSARLTGKGSDPVSSSPTRDDTTNDKKRKTTAPSTQASKKGKKATPKKQTKIEETMDIEKGDANGEDKKDEEMNEAETEDKEEEETAEAKTTEGDGETETIAEKAENGVVDPTKDEEPSEEAKQEGEPTGAAAQDEKKAEPEVSQQEDKQNGTKVKPEEKGAEKPTESAESKTQASTSMDDTGAVSHDTTKEPTTTDTTSTDNTAITENAPRASSIPSTILEKGLIYFFFRASVTTDHASSVSDIARSYIVLRPIPTTAALDTPAPLEDLKNNRLIAVPKKVLPKSGRDRFMAFVEKAGTTVQDLKDNFMAGSDYSTKTTGVRHAPAVTPVGEGVYAITSTGGGRQSHLAYMLTLPSESDMGDVQAEMGLAQQGSFALSVKNPEQKGPANASLPQGPDWPKEFLEEFRGLRWMPCQPKHLEYANAQVLLIGEGADVGKASEEGKGVEGAGEGKETAKEELEKLEEEDHERVEALDGEDAVFKDLKVSKGEQYPELKTSW